MYTAVYIMQLNNALKNKNVTPNPHEIYLRFGRNLNDILSPMPFCTFGKMVCSADDFDADVTNSDVCFTFNSGNKKPAKTVRHPGTADGLEMILDTQDTDSIGMNSKGFRVIFHNQGEFFDGMSGINIPPGFHSTIVISREEVVNLPAPYATNCKEKPLKMFSRYTREGCAFECDAELLLDKCGCRPFGYDGEIGGNMGLFLGYSLLTICEFVDFLASVFLSRRRRRVLAV